MNARPPPLSSATNVVGAAIAHDSARLHVAGEAAYTDDLPEPRGMLHAALGVSPIPHGTIESIGLERVIAAPAVVDVVTASDIPGINDVGPIQLQGRRVLPAVHPGRHDGDRLARQVGLTGLHREIVACGRFPKGRGGFSPSSAPSCGELCRGASSGALVCEPTPRRDVPSVGSCCRCSASLPSRPMVRPSDALLFPPLCRPTCVLRPVLAGPHSPAVTPACREVTYPPSR